MIWLNSITARMAEGSDRRLCSRGLRSSAALRRMLIPLTVAAALLVSSCGDHPASDGAAGGAPTTPSTPRMPVAEILERNRKLDDSRDSVQKMRARIQVENPASQLTPIPPEVQMTVYRKRMADGGETMLVEFTAPPTQRDLDALISVNGAGDVEGIRYNQSGNNFVSTKGVLNEDSLFGMTLQELLGGQSEKYDLQLIGEETFNQIPVYRLDGKLKPSTESKFQRLVMLVARDNFAMLEGELYDEHDELTRRLTVEKQAQIGGHWTRMRWTVDNRGRQKRIEFEIVDTKYDQNLSDSLFTRESLKKIATK